MSSDRRSFLKALGLTTAIVPHPETGRAEIVKAPDAPLINPTHGYSEVSEGYLYSGIDLGRNEMLNSYQLFLDTIGNPQHAWPHTNMMQPGVLPAPQAFAIERIGILFAPNVKPELAAAFAARYEIDLCVAEKLYFRRPLAALPLLKRMPDQIGPAPLEWQLILPIVIPPRCCFWVHLRGEPMRPAAPIRLWATLHGRILRLTQ